METVVAIIPTLLNVYRPHSLGTLIEWKPVKPRSLSDLTILLSPLAGDIN